MGWVEILAWNTFSSPSLPSLIPLPCSFLSYVSQETGINRKAILSQFCPNSSEFPALVPWPSPKHLLWHREEGDTHRMGQRNGVEEEGQEFMPKLFLVLSSAGSHCCPTVLPNTSQTYPEIPQALEVLGFPEAVQSCIHPEMGDLVPTRTWKNFRNPNHPFPTRQKDQLCPCSCSHPAAHRIVWRDEGSGSGPFPEIPRSPRQVRSPGAGGVIALTVWSPSLRLCPFHKEFLIAHESFGMFVAKDWWLSFSLSACHWGQFLNYPEAN